jgi:addiction module RelB/DinJ family antitoxin
MTETIQLEVDKDLKDSFEVIVHSYGLSTADALKRMIIEVRRTKSLPITTEPESKEVSPELAKMIEDAHDAYERGECTSYSTTQEAFDDILGVGWND